MRRRKKYIQTFCACLNSEDTCSDFLEQRKLFSSKDYNSFSTDILPTEILLKVSNRIFCGFDAIYTARNTFICHRKRSWKTDGSREIECLHALNVCSIQRSCMFPEKLEMSLKFCSIHCHTTRSWKTCLKLSSKCNLSKKKEKRLSHNRHWIESND